LALFSPTRAKAFPYSLSFGSSPELATVGVPPIQLRLDEKLTGGAVFAANTWMLQTAPSTFVADALAPGVVSLLYHEARHAEQWFRMARVLAGRGATAAELSKRLRMDPTVAALAVERPLREGPEVREADVWLRSVDSKQAHKAEARAAASLGPGQAARLAQSLAIVQDRSRDESERRRAFKDLQAYLREQFDYLSISFERDAYNVGALAAGQQGGDIASAASELTRMSFDELDERTGH